jgi:hypothetical protein
VYLRDPLLGEAHLHGGRGVRVERDRRQQAGDGGDVEGATAGLVHLERGAAKVNAIGQRRNNTAAAAELVQSADEAALTDPDISRVLPCVPELSSLLPWPGGIRRGATVAAVGSTSMLMTLLGGG